MKRALLLLPLMLDAQTELPAGWKQDPRFTHASIGYCVRDASTGQTVAEYNAGTALIPASTLKLTSTTAALDLLGKDFRFETKIGHTGSFNKSTGVLTGDLIITGGGDPTLQSSNFPGENVTRKWARILKEQGVKEIRGKIIGDASYFERTIPDSWIWGDIGNYFGAVPCGLSYTDNKFTIVYRTGAPGTKAILKAIEPAALSKKIKLRSDITANGTSDEAVVYGDPFGWEKEVRGTLPPGREKYEIEAALPDPALLCAEDLLSAMQKEGIICKGPATSKYEKDDSLLQKNLLFVHYSPPIDQIIYQTNMKSINLYCESLVKMLGNGSTTAGLNAVKEYWRKCIPDTGEIHLADGSGLSRANTITTSFQAMQLCNIYSDSAKYSIIRSSLPLAGRDVSMSKMGTGTVIANNLRAKTGYIAGVRAYCGYVTSASGRLLAFSVIFNNYNCKPSEAREAIEKWMVWMAGL
jgi:D-alanyl-D-alanine carboxypeptidase/D-alanyl-D-alanine-endopeptidase (penicillin-binding protein 4)